MKGQWELDEGLCKESRVKKKITFQVEDQNAQRPLKMREQKLKLVQKDWHEDRERACHDSLTCFNDKRGDVHDRPGHPVFYVERSN